jgi:hypothetical protein
MINTEKTKRDMDMKKLFMLFILLIMNIALAGCYNDIVGILQGKADVLKKTLILVSMPNSSSTGDVGSSQPGNPPAGMFDAQVDVITPQHSITDVGSSINLNCNNNVTNGDTAYSFNWQIMNSPTGSTAVLGGASTPTASLSPDKEGYYIIKLILSKDAVMVGTYYAYVGTLSVCHYIYSGATGSATGTDWTNAWTKLPATLTRGHTYYIADGTYPGYVCNTASNGIIPIYIKKAISTDHGTDIGWNSATLGSSQAVFSVADPQPTPPCPLLMNSSYIEFNGNVGAGQGSIPYGIKFINTTTNTGSWKFRNAVFLGDYPINAGGQSLSNITFKHCEITIDRLSSPGTFGLNVLPSIGSVTQLYIGHCYLHDVPGTILDLSNTSYSIFEYNIFARNHSDAVNHGEGVWVNQGSTTTHNIHRYNTYIDIEGTTIVYASANSDFYGNLIYWTPGYVNTNPTGRHQSGVTCNEFVGQGIFSVSGDNCNLYNNTTVGNNLGIQSNWSGNMGYYIYGNGCKAYNNLWVNCNHIFLEYQSGKPIDENYNAFYGYTMLVYQKGAHDQFLSGDPFVDGSSYNFHLKADTDSGYLLEIPYNFDMEGKIRGSSGGWSRGAYQY